METILPIAARQAESAPSGRDQQAFLALVEAHGGAILATLRRLCGNSQDADDLFQETALRVWRQFGERPWLRSPRAWLITIAYRAFLDDRKRASRRKSEPTDEYVDYRHPPVEGQLEQAETLGRLNARVGALPDEIRQVITLHYHGGLTIRQTAAAMGTTVAITKNRLHAGLKQLRSAIDELR